LLFFAPLQAVEQQRFGVGKFLLLQEVQAQLRLCPEGTETLGAELLLGLLEGLAIQRFRLIDLTGPSTSAGCSASCSALRRATSAFASFARKRITLQSSSRSFRVIPGAIVNSPLVIL
jgi:hypothetical protein